MNAYDDMPVTTVLRSRQTGTVFIRTHHDPIAWLMIPRGRAPRRVASAVLRAAGDLIELAEKPTTPTAPTSAITAKRTRATSRPPTREARRDRRVAAPHHAPARRGLVPVRAGRPAARDGVAVRRAAVDAPPDPIRRRTHRKLGGNVMTQWYILTPARETQAVDAAGWSAWRAKSEDWRIDKTDIGTGDVWVSTVFLGLDHGHSEDGPPVLFESMVFGGDYDQHCWRYTSYVAAQAGHTRIVVDLTAGVDPYEAEVTS
jgi:hypothetical protein